MTQDWQDCPTFESVAEARKRGEYIEWRDFGCKWVPWPGTRWYAEAEFRCRPAKPNTKTVLMCKALFRGGNGYTSYDVQVGTEEQYGRSFIQWLGEPYEVEVVS